MNGASRWFLAAAGNQSADDGTTADYRDAADYSHVRFNTIINSGAASSDVYGVAIKSDGTQFYHVGTDELLEAYNLSTAYNINTHGNRVAATSLYSINSGNGALTSIFFKPDGTALYTTDVDDNVYQYSLSTAWDITTISYVRAKDLGNVLNPNGIYFSPDGTKFFFTDWRRDYIYRYDMTTAWDISTSTRTGASRALDISATIRERAPRAVWLSDDGLKVYVVGTYRDTIYSFDLSTAWDITEIQGGADSSLYIGNKETVPLSMCFSSDGRYIYIGGGTGNGVDQYDRGA